MQGSPAEVRNTAARRLMARGRFREALDVLNEAIRIDPRYAESFDNRAAVFERLGMYPQADADRRKVADLGGVVRVIPASPTPKGDRGLRSPPPPPPIDPTPEVTTPVQSTGAADARTTEAVTAESADEDTTSQRRMVAAPRYPAPPRESSGAAAKSLATVLVSIGLLVAAGVGIYLALNTISDAIDGDDEAVQVPGEATPETETSGPTASPTSIPEDVEEALEGSPHTFETFASAWEDEEITASPLAVSTTISGFSTTPVDVTLTRDGSTMQISMLFYDSADGPRQDWDLGDRPTPKLGRNVPAGAFAWYNRNVVAVVVESDDAMRQDALAGFLAP